jgi:Fic family protein
MIKIIEEIDLRQKELETLRPIKPQLMSKISDKYKLEYNYYSNNLEGNTLNVGETRSLILHSYTATIDKKLKDINEMKSHIELYEEVGFLTDKILTKDKKPLELSQYLIKNLHKKIFVEDEKRSREENGITKYYTILAGEYKTDQNHVKTTTGELFYYAEPHEVPQLMMDLIDWYNLNRDKIHPVILAAIFHYKFIRIHPFGDGNGRMSRFLMNMILQSSGYALAIVKSDDKNRDKYLQSLRKTDANFATINEALSSEEVVAFQPFIDEIAELELESLEIMISGAKGEDITETGDILKLFEMELKIKKKAGELHRSLLKDKVIDKAWLELEGNYEAFYEYCVLKLNNKVIEFVNILEEYGPLSFHYFSKIPTLADFQVSISAYNSSSMELIINEKTPPRLNNYFSLKVEYFFEELRWKVIVDLAGNIKEKSYDYGQFLTEEDIKEIIAFLVAKSKVILGQ